MNAIALPERRDGQAEPLPPVNLIAVLRRQAQDERLQALSGSVRRSSQSLAAPSTSGSKRSRTTAW
jgi:hypothetical protein